MARVDLIDRYRGCLLGLAVGDALGTALEFSRPGSFAPITDMVGGGPSQQHGHVFRHRHYDPCRAGQVRADCRSRTGRSRRH
jgi:hypothetical protein